MMKLLMLCSFLVTFGARGSVSFVHLRLGGGLSLRVPRPEPEVATTEGSGGFDEERHFHLKQLQNYYNQNKAATCQKVQDFVVTESGGKCPRGWTNLPECDKPDIGNLRRCSWKEKAGFQLPKMHASLRAVLCKGERMRCLSQVGIIPASTQLLHAPRNYLSDKAELVDALFHLKNIVAVDFARNNFENLSEKTFHNSKCLRLVNFDQNFLLDIPENLFKSNRALTSVSMIENDLDYLPPNIFRWNPFLTVINFERNNITKLAPRIFCRNHRLEVIRLNGNSIPIIPPELFSANPFLKEVGLARNKISVIPKMLFRKTRNLQEVILSRNTIRKIPGDLFHNCQELHTIKLDRNMLTTLPARLFEKNLKLRLVDISYNRFHSVNPKLYKIAPVVRITPSQWKDQQGVLEEENEDGKWHPSKPQPQTSLYRKTALHGA